MLTVSSGRQLTLNDPELIRDTYAGRLWPDEQIRVFSESRSMFPARLARRGGQSRPLQYASEPLEELAFVSSGKQFDLYDYVSRNRIVGLLLAKDSKVLLEQYHFGITPDTRWMSMSMAKSISTTLVGAAIRDGYIEHVDDLLSKYVPALQGGGYEGVSIRQLLRMTSGVRWNESHTDPSSERRHMLELQIAGGPGTILRYMSGLPRVAAPGTRWNYSTGETHLVGELLQAATNRWVADYLSEKIWSRIGMEADAPWWLESPDGLEVAGSGISATLRDYARFGLFVLAGGRFDGEQVLPEGWIDEASTPHRIDGRTIAYGYMWWLQPSEQSEYDDGAFSARGIFGQRIYINPAKQLLIVALSARSKPRDSESIFDNDFFDAVARTV